MLCSVPQLHLGPELLTGLEHSPLDLGPQILGDLPVHGACHRPSSELLTRDRRVVVPVVRTIRTIRLARIFGLIGLYPAHPW